MADQSDLWRKPDPGSCMRFYIWTPPLPLRTGIIVGTARKRLVKESSAVALREMDDALFSPTLTSGFTNIHVILVNDVVV